jgi:hypothetical protein
MNRHSIGGAAYDPDLAIWAARYLASSHTPQINDDPRIVSHGKPRK